MNERYNVVNEKNHTERIEKLFSDIAPQYDYINRRQSFRRDIYWRRFASSKLRFFNTMHYLDVATGTADLALEVSSSHEGVSSTGVDISDELLSIGRDKAIATNMSERVKLMHGNALDLEFDNDSFDVAGIAFGIRNIKNRLHALKEMTRVVVPGGQVMVLELSYHGTGIIKPLYCFYLKAIIPFMARFEVRNREAYQYLGRSIIDFPAPAEFCTLMREAGLRDVKSWPLTFGVARLFIGTKPS